MKKPIVKPRKPFVDGAADIRRWRAKKKWERRIKRLREWLRGAGKRDIRS